MNKEEIQFELAKIKLNPDEYLLLKVGSNKKAATTQEVTDVLKMFENANLVCRGIIVLPQNIKAGTGILCTSCEKKIQFR